MPESDKNQGLRYAGLGIEFAAAVAGLTLVGYWVDRHFGSSPWGVLTGAAIGLIGGTYNMIREALSAGRRSPPGGRPETAGPGDEPGLRDKKLTGERGLTGEPGSADELQVEGEPATDDPS